MNEDCVILEEMPLLYKCWKCKKEVTTIYSGADLHYYCEKCVDMYRKQDIDAAQRESASYKRNKLRNLTT